MPVCPHKDMNVPEDCPQEIVDALMEVLGGEDLAGIIYSDDYKSIEVRQVVGDATVVNCYVYNEETHHFDLAGYNPDGSARL